MRVLRSAGRGGQRTTAGSENTDRPQSSLCKCVLKSPGELPKKWTSGSQHQENDSVGLGCGLGTGILKSSVGKLWLTELAINPAPELTSPE